MRILGVSSSPLYEGHTARLVRSALSGAEAAGGEVDEVHLPGVRINPCQGCLTCMATGTCVLSDDFGMLRQRLLEADGWILGSPTYGMTINAQMKILFERLGMFAVYTSLFEDKYVVGISTAGGMGARRTAKHLTEIVGGFFGSGRRSGILAIHRGWEDIDATAQARAVALGRRLVSDVRTSRPYRFQRLGGRFIGRVAVASMVRSSILEHRHDRMKAVYETLVARGKLRPPRDEGISR